MGLIKRIGRLIRRSITWGSLGLALWVDSYDAAKDKK